MKKRENKLILLFLATGLAMASQGNGQETRGQLSFDLERALSTLDHSENSDQLEKVAVEISKIKDPHVLDELANRLLDPKFLLRLDTQKEYEKQLGFWHYRYWEVLDAIGKQSSPQAEEALLNLFESEKFNEDIDRKTAVIYAFGGIHDPSQKLLAILEAQKDPISGNLDVGVITALTDMQSPKACEMIEKLVLAKGSKSYEDNKPYWFKNDIIAERSNPTTVQLYKRLIAKNIPDSNLRNVIVQTLFEFRPDKWYNEDQSQPSVPDRKEASTEVLRELLTIADLTKKLDLTADTRAGVENGRKEIKAILAKRVEKK